MPSSSVFCKNQIASGGTSLSSEEDRSSEEVANPLEKSLDADLKSQLKEIDTQIKTLRDKKGAIEQIKVLRAKKAAINNEIYKRRFLRPPRKIVLVVALLGIIIYAIILRTGHLLDGNYYYIISTDSYFFNRMAELIISGSTTIPTAFGTGLAYPLAYTSIVFASVFRMSASSALVLAGEVLPLVLAIAIILLMFVMVNRTHNWVAGVFAAFAMAIMPSAYFVQASGYLDRDALSMLLIMLGVFVYYLQRNWHFKIGKWDLSWLIAGIAVLGIEGMLFLEWSAGLPLLFAIIFGCLIVEFINYFFQDSFKGYRLQQLTLLVGDAEFIINGLKGVLKRFVKAAKQTHWKLFLFVVLVNALILIGSPSMFSLLAFMVSYVVGGSSTAAEAQSGFTGLLAYHILLIPLFLGFLVALKRRREGDLFWLGWLFAIFILAFFAQRLYIYLAPAAAVFIGSAFIPMFLRFRTSRARWKILITIFLALVIFLSFASFTMETPRAMSVDTNWHNALIYCNQNTSTNARIMTWWEYGYWIVDIADRAPVFSPGGQTTTQLKDVALAYCTNDTAKTVKILKQYNAKYIIFSTLEVQILPELSTYALEQAYGDRSSVPDILQSSVYYRFLYGNTTSEDGLTRVYSSPENQPEVVVLKLNT